MNAGDLRKLPFPRLSTLQDLGKRVADELPPQEQIDKITQDVVFGGVANNDPLDAVRKITQAQEVLAALGLPKPQQNERSALSLLALLNLLPQAEWKTVEAPLCGVHAMMDFFRNNYGKNYAENSRETIRRQTLHQFRDAGMLLVNPDEPERPINSGKTVYQINPELLELLREFNSPKWKDSLAAYLKRRLR